MINARQGFSLLFHRISLDREGVIPTLTHEIYHPARSPGSWIVLPAASSHPDGQGSEFVRLSSPHTVAGPQRIFTAFPRTTGCVTYLYFST